MRLPCALCSHCLPIAEFFRRYCIFFFKAGLEEVILLEVTFRCLELKEKMNREEHVDGSTIQRQRMDNPTEDWRVVSLLFPL